MGVLFSIIGIVVFLDQLTKFLILSYFPIHAAKEIIPGLFNLVHARNTGAAFSILAEANSSGRQAFFIAVTLFVLGFLLFGYRKLRRDDTWTRVSYSLISGGAVGNLIDRLRFGEVVDFLDFYLGTHHWPAFNVADSAITTGALMLLLSLIRGK